MPIFDEKNVFKRFPEFFIFSARGSVAISTPAPTLTLVGYDSENEEIDFTTAGAFATATLYWAVAATNYTTGATVEAAAGADASGSFAITQSDTTGTMDLSALTPGDYQLSAVVKMPDGSYSNVVNDTITVPTFAFPTGVESGTFQRGAGTTATFGAANEGDLKLLLISDESTSQMAIPTGYVRTAHVASSTGSLNVFSRQVGAGGDAGGGVVFTPNGTNWCWAQVLLRPDTGGVLEINPTIATSSGTGDDHNAPTLASAAANSLIISATGLDNGGVDGGVLGNYAGVNPAAPWNEAELWNNSSFGDLVCILAYILRDTATAPTATRRFETFSSPNHANATFEVRYAP